MGLVGLWHFRHSHQFNTCKQEREDTSNDSLQKRQRGGTRRFDALVLISVETSAETTAD